MRRWLVLGIAILLVSLGASPTIRTQNPGPLSSLSVCPWRDPGPNSGWIRVPQDYESVGEAVEVAKEQGLLRIWVGPGLHPAGQPYPWLFPQRQVVLQIYIDRSLILCGSGRDLTVIEAIEEFEGEKWEHPVVSIFGPDTGEPIEVLIEGLTISGGLDSGITAGGKVRLKLQNVRIFGTSGVYGGIHLYRGVKANLYNVQVIANYKAFEIGGVGPVTQVMISNSQFSANRGGLQIIYDANVTITQTQISANNYGILTDGAPQITISNSEISYNNGEGIDLRSRAQLEAYDNRIIENKGYGIMLLEPPCEEAGGKDLFDGEVRGRGNEIKRNAKGDLCPPDFPWPPGFVKP